MIEDLKVCPFCGNETIKITSTTKTQHHKKNVTYQGICGSCHARGPAITVSYVFEDFSKQDIQQKLKESENRAIVLWNQRSCNLAIDYSDFDECK